MPKFKRMNDDGTVSDYQPATKRVVKKSNTNMNTAVGRAPKPGRVSSPKPPDPVPAPAPQPAPVRRKVRRPKPAIPEPPKMKISKANFDEEPLVHNDGNHAPEIDEEEAFSQLKEPIRRVKSNKNGVSARVQQKPLTRRPRRVVEEVQFQEEDPENEYYDEYDDEEDYDSNYTVIDDADEYDEEDDDYDYDEEEEYYVQPRQSVRPQRRRYVEPEEEYEEEIYIQPIKRKPARKETYRTESHPRQETRQKRPNVRQIVEKEVAGKVKYEKPYVLDQKGISLLTNTIIDALGDNFVSRDDVDLIIERKLQQMVIDNDVNQ